MDKIEWAIQRHWQHLVLKTQDEDKKETQKQNRTRQIKTKKRSTSQKTEDGKKNKIKRTKEPIMIQKSACLAEKQQSLPIL